jgi:hypothetical protein
MIASPDRAEGLQACLTLKHVPEADGMHFCHNILSKKKKLRAFRLPRAQHHTLLGPAVLEFWP